MAKIRITKMTETVSAPKSGPGGKILTDEQVEQWSRFAEKNRNLNFDQKWDAFSKSNPTFGATKQNVADALTKYRTKLTERANEQTERSYSFGAAAAPLGNKDIFIKTDDIFLPILKEGKMVGRDTEDLTPSSVYKSEPNPQSAFISRIFKYGNQIPSFENVQPNSGIVDRVSGIVRYLDNDGNEFAVNLVDVENRPGYAEKLKEQFSGDIRSLKSTPESKKLRVQK